MEVCSGVELVRHAALNLALKERRQCADSDAVEYQWSVHLKKKKKKTLGGVARTHGTETIPGIRTEWAERDSQYDNRLGYSVYNINQATNTQTLLVV